VKDFEDTSERDVRLRDGDIFFIDIGPIWGDTEGDGGETFVVGQNPSRHAALRRGRQANL
jgi:methionyl aminopeptidase